MKHVKAACAAAAIALVMYLCFPLWWVAVWVIASILGYLTALAAVFSMIAGTVILACLAVMHLAGEA